MRKTVLLVVLLLLTIDFPVSAQRKEGQMEELMRGRNATITGKVVVMDKTPDGQIRRLALETPAETPPSLNGKLYYWIWDTNKGRELLHRVGQDIEITGLVQLGLNRTRSIRVTQYKVLTPNVRVTGAEGFRLSFLSGGLDHNGKFMGGTEIRALAAFDGKLFAGTGYWNDTPEGTNDPYNGAQVLVLDKADGWWRLDNEFGPSGAAKEPDLLGVSFLEPVSFVTDYQGKKLASPVRMLTTGGFGRRTLYARLSGTDVWFDTRLDAREIKAGETPFGDETRSAVGHTDSVTNVSYIFAGLTSAGIWRGAYRPELPGKIEWDAQPEFSGEGRAMGLADCDGVLYASFGNNLYRRVDGRQPRWEIVYRDAPDNKTGGSAIRRATAITSPDGKHKSILFGVEGSKARVVRLDPFATDKATIELEMAGYFKPIRHAIVNYNGVAKTKDVADQEVTIMGMEMLRPLNFGGFYDWREDGLIFWRTEDGAYHLNKIHDPTLAAMPPLVGVRQIIASPFADEQEVFYFAGFDTNGHPVHNTGWIFKAHRNSILRDFAPGGGAR